MDNTAQRTSQQAAVQQQAGKLLTQFAGYVGFKTIEIGLKNGLLSSLAEYPGGLTAQELATHAGTDPFYTAVWSRSAFGAEIIEADENGRYTLAAHIDKLLLDPEFPGYVGGIPAVFSQPEVFDTFSENLKSGKRIWWDETSPEFIQAVSGTGKPFYNRLIPAGLDNIPGLVERLNNGARVLELACGVGRGLVKFAETFPQTEILGVDGDEHSVDIAWKSVRAAGLDGRAAIVESSLEDFVADGEYDLVFINISMHECREIDTVADNVKKALKSGGMFVISDFPFPADHAGLRTAPARVMSGIQFFEAQIDDQLVPTATFVELLEKHGFTGVTAADITPVHNLIWGQK